MSIRTKRWKTRLGSATIAASLVAGLFGVSTASADLYDDAAAIGDIRVAPTYGSTRTAQNQEATLLQPGTTSTASSMQVSTQNEWLAGDRILVQLYGQDGANCSSIPRSVAFSKQPEITVSGPYEVVAPAGANAPGSPWGANSAGSADVDMASLDQLVPVTGTALATLTAPTFNVNMLSSTGCDVNELTNIAAIQFTNEATGNDGDFAWVFNVDGVELVVGAAVAPGPIRAVPYGQNARPGTPAFENTANLFGANQSSLQSGAGEVANLWTNPAYVVPVSVTGTLKAGVAADGSLQKISDDLTFAETRADAWSDGEYTICLAPRVESISDAGPSKFSVAANSGLTVNSVAVTNAAGVVDPSSDENCLTFDITVAAAPAPAVIDSITVSNLHARVYTPGTISALITQAPASFISAHLTPDDQSVGTSAYSDVNVGNLAQYLHPLGAAAELLGRIGGADRFETAAKIAMAGNEWYNDGDCANNAIVVSGNSYPDALSAAYLAGAFTFQQGGNFTPILTTSSNSLDPSVRLALSELGVKRVYVVGGSAAVSETVASQIASQPRTNCDGTISDTNETIQVFRASGATRYATNKAVIDLANNTMIGTYDYQARSRYQPDLSGPGKRTVLVASGENFADALSAGPFASGNMSYGFPLVLTTSEALSSTAATTMANLDTELAIIVGGTSAVSSATQSAIEAMGIDTIRLSGADRYATNAALNGWALAGPAGTTPVVDQPYEYGLGLAAGGPGLEVYLASGTSFADALAVAPLVSYYGDLLALTERGALPAPTKALIASLRTPRIANWITGIGLGNAITTSVLDEANATLWP